MEDAQQSQSTSSVGNPILDALTKHGFVVVDDVFPIEMMEETLKDFLKYVQEIALDSGIELDWKSLMQKFLPISGALQYPAEMSHLRLVERLRNDMNLLNVFRRIYGLCKNESMVTSYERINYEPSPFARGGKYRDVEGSWHVSQNDDVMGFDCVRGYVDVMGACDYLEVVKETHNCFESLKYGFKSWNCNTRSFSDEELESVLPGWQKQRTFVKSRPGSLVLWDCRLLHRFRKNLVKLRDPRECEARMIIYVTAWPASRLSEKNKRDREDCKKRMRACNHYPDCRKFLSVNVLYRKVDHGLKRKIVWYCIDRETAPKKMKYEDFVEDWKEKHPGEDFEQVSDNNALFTSPRIASVVEGLLELGDGVDGCADDVEVIPTVISFSQELVNPTTPAMMRYEQFGTTLPPTPYPRYQPFGGSQQLAPPTPRYEKFGASQEEVVWSLPVTTSHSPSFSPVISSQEFLL